jgi:hypothetical protein
MADYFPLVLESGVHHNIHGPDALVVDILKLSAGAAGPGLSSVYMTPGALLTVPESGAVESDGTNLYWTDSLGTRRPLNNLNSIPAGDSDYHWPYTWYGHDGIVAGGISDKGHLWVFGNHDLVLGSASNPQLSAWHLIGRGTSVFANGIVEELASIEGKVFLINNGATPNVQIPVWSIANWQLCPKTVYYGQLSVRPWDANQGANNLFEWQNISGVALAAMSPSAMFLAANGTEAAPGISWLTDPSCGIYHVGTGATASLNLTLNGYTFVSLAHVGSYFSFISSTVRHISLAIYSAGPGAYTNSVALYNVGGYAITTIGTENGGSAIIAGAVANDSVLRCTQKLHISADDGASSAIIVAGTRVGIRTVADAASTFHTVASATVTAAAGAAWNGINFAASTLTLTGATTPITTLNYVTIAAPTVTAASAVVTTDFFTCRIGAATFAGVGPASATRNWCLGVDGNTKLGGGITAFGRQILFGASPYAVVEGDFFLEVQSNGGAITVTLPALTGGTVPNGRICVVIDSGYSAAASNITVARGNAGDKINNAAASYVINTGGACIWLKANTTNANWEIV